eukprot:GEMP01070789.1.p1 GENE.GEMP01070789.1~~GEMP01070789.1.p1  ORF type:complete len:163 (+),score=39.24 GEMP01070789.1:125-613(+)
MARAAALRSLVIHQLQTHDCTPAEVIPKLFIGSVGALQNCPCTHVLRLAHGLPAPHSSEEADVIVEDLLMQDKGSMEEFRRILPKAIEFIEHALQEQGSVLIVCLQGKSRSVAIIMGYLVMHKEFSVDLALECVRSARPQAQPNVGFMLALRSMERTRAQPH